jgi:hypothetical protein
MRVREEQRKVQRAALEFRQQRLAKFAQAGAGVENDDVAAAADFDASGVAAVTRGVRAGRRDRAANAPELDLRSRIDESTLAQTRGKTNLKIPPPKFFMTPEQLLIFDQPSQPQGETSRSAWIRPFHVRRKFAIGPTAGRTAVDWWSA